MNPREDGARKTAFVIIDADNRDKGKRYLLTEMDAVDAEKWFCRVVAYLARRGVAVPMGAEMMGMAAMPSFSVLQMLSWIDDDALMGTILSCVKAWPEGAPLARTLQRTDTEEIITLAQLRLEVLALHTGFSTAVVLWTLSPALAAAMNLEKPATLPVDSSSTQTSPTPSP